MALSVGSPSFDNKKVFVDDSFADIIPWFLDNRKEDIKKVREFAEVSDFEQIQRMGHRWKGTCASYGFEKLSEAGELLEVLSQQKNKEDILSLINRAEDYLGKIDIVYITPSEADNSNEASV